MKTVKKKSENTQNTQRLFDYPINKELLALYVDIYRKNQRQGTSKVKTRGEVSGGGKKPWRQKGTGRARAGSTRAPTWVHGGKAHGPTPRDYSKDFPVRLKKNALACALSLKDSVGCVSIWETLKFDVTKTSKLLDLLSDVWTSGKLTLVTNGYDKNIFRAGKNVKDLKLVSANNINAYDVILAKKILLMPGSEKILKARV